MSKLLYTIKEIFSTDFQNGCLGINEAEGYYIAPYQRGYKWQSSEDWTDSNQVNTLLRDVYDAWKRNQDSTYYLQFITVKRTSDRRFLEVIDGQQRLTTLSILSAVLKNDFNLEDFAGDCIDYYSSDEEEGGSKECLSGFHASPVAIKTNDEIDDQTIWFMTQAFRNLGELLSQKFSTEMHETDGKGAISDFYHYLCNNTFVIVNLVQDNVQGEEVFENLNGRKIPLTDAELIKGLLLCQAARRSTKLSYNEVLEHRADMGRTWDEMEWWLARPEVGPFFFDDGQFAIYDFLLLVLLQHSKDIQDHEAYDLYNARVESLPSMTKRYQLFNQYYERITSPNDALDFFYAIEDMYWRMRDAFDDVARHNAYGFLLFRTNSVNRLRQIGELTSLGSAWQVSVKELVRKKFSGRDEKLDSVEAFCKSYQYFYGSSDNNEKVRQDLMLLNCFELDENGAFCPNGKLAFPFYNVDGGSTKSMEHVQCQSPEGADNIDKMVGALQEYRGNVHDWLFTIRSARRILQCSDYYEEEATELKEFLGNPKNIAVIEIAVKFENDISFMPEDSQWEELAGFYRELLDIHFKRFELPLSKLRPNDFGDVDTKCLHSIGNIVLVTGSLNTAFLNRVFAAKRKVLRDRINTGEIVPPHTFNVFSKMSGLGSHTDCWCAEDAASNAIDTLAQLYKLRKALQNDNMKGGDVE